MQQNFPQSIKMQMSHENNFTEGKIIPEQDSLMEFLEKNYDFPSNNLDEINEFLLPDMEMEKIIRELPCTVSAELEYEKISIDFMKETDPIEKIIEIIIYSNSNEKTLLKKEDLICDKLIDGQHHALGEYIILVEPRN